MTNLEMLISKVCPLNFSKAGMSFHFLLSMKRTGTSEYRMFTSFEIFQHDLRGFIPLAFGFVSVRAKQLFFFSWTEE